MEDVKAAYPLLDMVDQVNRRRVVSLSDKEVKPLNST
ncbi:unnamed protein product [Trichobilharzia regenti]|nr:unnamed protein product [Trichobilharzia regenti]